MQFLSRVPYQVIGHAFAARIRTENRGQASICPVAPQAVSVRAELAVGHRRYRMTDVQPLLKPNKTQASYRPISPLSTLAKSVEKTIYHKQQSMHHYTTRLLQKQLLH